jgi:hypothetical protein
VQHIKDIGYVVTVKPELMETIKAGELRLVEFIGFNAPTLTLSSATYWNPKHPLVQWLLSVRESAENGHEVVTRSMVKAAVEHLTYIRGFDRFISEWRSVPGMPAAFMPPEGWDEDRLRRQWGDFGEL